MGVRSVRMARLVRLTFVVNFDRPRSRTAYRFRLLVDDILDVAYAFFDIRVQSFDLLFGQLTGDLLDLRCEFLDLDIQILDVLGECETSVVSAEHPETSFFFDGRPALRSELHLGHIVYREPLDGCDYRIGAPDGFGIGIGTIVDQMIQIDDDVHRLTVGAIIYPVLYVGIAKFVDPRLVDGTVVEMTPNGAIRWIEDVQGQVTDEGILLCQADFGDVETEELVVEDSFVQGFGGFCRFLWFDGLS
jgi:hypothetical protein